MIGTEYLESRDPLLDNNYYRGGLLTTAAEFGVLNLGALGLKHVHKSMNKDYRSKANTFNTQYPKQYYGRHNTPEFKELGDIKTRQRVYKGYAKTLSRLGKFTGAMGLFTMGFDLSRDLIGASNAFIDSKDSIEKARRRPIYNSEDSYFDSRAAFTQRQRAIQVIHNSQMSTRAAMGNESSFMHY